MNAKPFIALFCTALVVVACGRGCTKDPVIPDDDFRPTPTATDGGARPTATPSPTPTMVMRTFVVPDSVKVNAPFKVQAYLKESAVVEVFADTYKLGTMGWSLTCKCKTLTIQLNTPGSREIRFMVDGEEMESEVLKVE